MGFGKVRLESQGLLVMCRCLVELALVLHRGSQIVVRLGIVWVDGQRREKLATAWSS